MNKKRMIITILITVLIIIFTLWISGIIPKQIAKISATNYLKKNFPKVQLEYVDIEWSSNFGGYFIKFKDKDNETHSFIMNNKYLPISLGQGLFGFAEEYENKYESQNIDNEDIFDIGNEIETIINSRNQESSNPYDYINASKQEYNKLLEHPKETFEYSIKDLIDSNASNGLVSYIEVILCSEINKNFQYDFSSANDYLEKYKEFLNRNDSVLNDHDIYTKSLLN